MKQIYFTLFFFISAFTSFGQSPPNGISFQGIARNAQGFELVNQMLVVTATLEFAQTGQDILFSETHAVDTDDFGVFQLVIGQGTYVEGTFDSLEEVPWNLGSVYLNVSIDNGGETISLGSQEFQTYPFAFYAARAGTVDNVEDDDAWQDLPNGVVAQDINVGIRIPNPSSSLVVNGSMGQKVEVFTGSATLGNLNNIVLADVSGGAVSLGLPAAADSPFRIYTIKRYNSANPVVLDNDVTITANGTDLLEGQNQQIMTGAVSNTVQIVSDGNNWLLIGGSF